MSSVRGSNANGEGEFFNEFSALDLLWKEAGYTYCWLNKDMRNVQTAKRRGWHVCNAELDFLDKGCPSDEIPGERAADGTLLFGDVILAKMPVGIYSNRAQRNVEKARTRRRGEIERAMFEGERVASVLRGQGAQVGDNILTERAG